MMLGLLVLAAPSLAAAPTLVAVVPSGDHLVATWTLPVSEHSELIELASSPTTGSDGFFADASVIDFALLAPADTSWQSSVALPPGTYYLHIKGEDEDQDPFSTDWSNILALVIPGPSTTPETTPASTPAPTPSVPLPPAPAPPQTGRGRVSRLWVSQKVRGPARTAFPALQRRVYANLSWSALPAPNHGFRVVWIGPNGKPDRTYRARAARLGATACISLANGDFRHRGGRWVVKVMVGTATIGSRAFSVQAVRRPKA